MGDISTIVLAEDDDAVRRMMAVLLRYFGHRVLEARDGHEAALLCESDVMIDLLITDLIMPRVTGWELLQRLCLRPHPPRVLVVSALAVDASTIELPKLSKPFTPQQLRTAVDAALAGPPLPAQLPLVVELKT